MTDETEWVGRFRVPVEAKQDSDNWRRLTLRHYSNEWYVIVNDDNEKEYEYETKKNCRVTKPENWLEGGHLG